MITLSISILISIIGVSITLLNYSDRKKKEHEEEIKEAKNEGKNSGKMFDDIKESLFEMKSELRIVANNTNDIKIETKQMGDKITNLENKFVELNTKYDVLEKRIDKIEGM